MMANKYFDIKELVPKEIYEELGEEKCLDLFNPIALKALEEVREILNIPLICNNWASGGSRNYCGYRPKGCKIGVTNSQHCVDKDTEILTDNGWKTYANISINDCCYSYNITKGIIEITPINDIIIKPFKGQLISIKNRIIDICVTDQHRLLTKTFNNYKEREYYKFEFAKDVFNKRRNILNSGNCLNSTTESIYKWKLLMAVIADGYIISKCNKFSGFGFKLVKTRDILELEYILTQLGIPIKKSQRISYITNNGDPYYCWEYYIKKSIPVVTEIYQIITKDKKIPKSVLKLPAEYLTELIITYAKFDGSIDSRTNCSNLTIYGKDKCNIDMLQQMCILSNNRSIIRKFNNYSITISDRTWHIGDFYHLYVTLRHNESRISETNWAWKHYEGVVWCIRNKNQTIITRRNGKVAIIGNCQGNAFDLISNSKSAKQMRYELEKNQSKLTHPIRIEKWDGNGNETTWLHIDTKNFTGNQKIYFFKA